MCVDFNRSYLKLWKKREYASRMMMSDGKSLPRQVAVFVGYVGFGKGREGKGRMRKE